MQNLDPFKVVGKVLKSRTLGPGVTFTEIHVLEAIELIGLEKTVGRVKLARKLGLGEGVTRTLLKHLKKNGLITIYPKLGCKLTKKGEEIHGFIKSGVFGPVEIPKNSLGLGAYNIGLLVRRAAEAVRFGLEQRDAAMKVGARGATTLVFTRNFILMPGVNGNCFKNMPEIRSMIISSLQPSEGDVIVIGSAESRVEAELGAKAAAFETLKQLYRYTSKT